jgi:hypothetical protein
VTAEIAVMNEEAIALAADSAVTGPAKIFTSANKIFALSKYHPVALMVFNSAQFHSVPWETIVKQYRRELGDKCFPTLDGHVDHFLKYFNTAKALFPPEAQQRGTGILVYSMFQAILNDAFRDVEGRMAQGDKLTGKEVVEEIEGSIAWHHGRWKAAKLRPKLPKNYREVVRKKYAGLVDAAIDAIFERVPLSTRAKRQLRQLLPWIASKDLPFERLPTHSGIVIAGFGSQDVFPRLRRFDFECVIADRLKFVERPPIDVGPDERAVIVPFAQREQVETFMEGMDHKLREHLSGWWHKKLNELVGEVGNHLKLSAKKQEALAEAFRDRCTEIVGEEYESTLSQFSWNNNVEPIIDIVGMLPKDELAEMAESLVNLTSFKRRVTPEAETVGGPIDVAVISRGDGFIWIKRKHYFNTELNPHFLSNYYRGEEHGKSK